MFLLPTGFHENYGPGSGMPQTVFSGHEGPVSRLKPLIIVLLSCITFSLSLYALSQLDYPAILFVRSLHNSVIEQIGNLGNRLGDGKTLAILSFGFFLVGFGLKKDVFRQTGIDSLVAHALAGIVVQIPKHIIGRPRPRFAHQEAFEYGASFEAGLDAFPSGHSTASFAVAAVLARYFPAMSWVWYSLASFVGLSRYLRGSHFPTDVLAGAVLGFLIGYVCARSYAEWRKSLYEALPKGLPLLVGGFALFWITFHQPLSGGLAMGMDWLGLFMLFGGIALRWNLIWNHLHVGVDPHNGMFRGTMLIGLGLALTTHSPFVIMLACIVGLVWWMRKAVEPENTGQPYPAREVLISLFLIGVTVAFRVLNGLIPLG